jgi:hypothetical protein
MIYNIGIESWKFKKNMYSMIYITICDLPADFIITIEELKQINNSNQPFQMTSL